MMLWMLVFWAGILVLAFALASWLFPAGPAGSQSTARDILDARYARGELTRDQYRQMQHELAPESRWRGQNLNILIVVLILAALVLVSAFGGFGMHGGWPGPGYPGRPGEWPSWMPHMWGR
jgi:putative membrane protein